MTMNDVISKITIKLLKTTTVQIFMLRILLILIKNVESDVLKPDFFFF